MRRMSLGCVATLVALAVGAVAASLAVALPELLPASVGTAIFGKSFAESPKLRTESGTSVECAAAAVTGNVSNDTSSSFHLKFTGCKSETFGVACTGTETGDASGVILTLGTADYIYDHLGTGGELGVALLFLISPATVFNCSPLAKVQVSGSVICLVEKPLESNTAHAFHCTQSNGVQNERAWWNDAGIEEKASLLVTVNGGPAEGAGEQATATLEVGGVPEKVAFEND